MQASNNNNKSPKKHLNWQKKINLFNLIANFHMVLVCVRKVNCNDNSKIKICHSCDWHVDLKGKHPFWIAAQACEFSMFQATNIYYLWTNWSFADLWSIKRLVNGEYWPSTVVPNPVPGDLPTCRVKFQPCFSSPACYYQVLLKILIS